MFRTKVKRQRSSLFKTRSIPFSDDLFLHKFSLTGDQIDTGSFSRILKGVNLATEEIVAVKTISTVKMSSGARKLLENEIIALERLNHSNILKFIACGSASHKVYIATDYCEGGNLLDKTAEIGNLPESVCIDVLIFLAQAINHCHHHGVVHRDLKPENILLRHHVDNPYDFSWVKSLVVGDFGCAAVRDESIPSKRNWKLKTVCGSVGYMAPEVILKKKYGIACDYWGLGIILFILLSGYHPFIEPSTQQTQLEISTLITEHKIKRDENTWQDISSKMEKIVFSLMKQNPKERLNMIQAIEAALLRGDGVN